MAAASHSNFSWFASVSGSRWPDGPIESAPTRFSLRQISTLSLARWAERLKANISHCDRFATGIPNNDTPITHYKNERKKKARAKCPRLVKGLVTLFRIFLRFRLRLDLAEPRPLPSPCGFPRLFWRESRRASGAFHLA